MISKTSAKSELLKLAAQLSSDECEHVLSLVRNIAMGERVWEDDVGVFYNEYVKARGFGGSAHLTSVLPVDPAHENGIFAPVPIVKTYPDALTMPMAVPQSPHGEILDNILKRRSRREFEATNIPHEGLSQLLYYSAGAVGSVDAYDYDHLPLRAFPSSGGLQSSEVYLYSGRVAELAEGVYHYHPLRHALELLRPGDHRAIISDLALGQPWVETSAVVVFIAGCYDRLRWKYGERAYRYMCMDAGCLAENLYLAGEALGYGVCAIAGFSDARAERLLDLDGEGEMALLMICVGVPSAE